MVEQDLYKSMNKIINRFILKSKKFCDCYCIPDGLTEILMFSNRVNCVPEEVQYSEKLCYDFDYFAFTKSTKSLMAIKRLMNDHDIAFNEDCLMQVRSIFENHIMRRYISEHIGNDNDRKNIVEDFFMKPLGINYNLYYTDGSRIKDHNNETVGKIILPGTLKMGKELEYYNDFYSFLCQHTHCSFSTLPCYMDDSGHFGYSYSKQNFYLLTPLMAIFVYEKLYEGVTTVRGEDFDSKKEEQSYYDLAYDAIELEIEVIDYLIDYYANKRKEKIDYVLEKYIGMDNFYSENQKMIKILQEMKASLFDNEIGSLDKSKYKDHKFERLYIKYD